MRVSDGGSSTTPVQTPKPAPPATPAPATTTSTAATAVAPTADSIKTSTAASPAGSSSSSAAASTAGTSTAAPPNGTQGASSTATWPGGSDQIDLSGLTGVQRKLAMMDAQDARDSGTFNDGAPSASQNDRRIAQAVTDPVRTAIQNNQTPTDDDLDQINRYVAGNIPGQKSDSTEPQRLQSVIAALGPQGTQQWLQSGTRDMSDGDYKNLQSSFNQLVSSGQLTEDDARQLVGGQVAQNTSANPNFYADSVSGLVNGLGNDPNSVAFKNAYAHESISQASLITSGLQNGGFKNVENGQDNARSERAQLYAQASQALNATPNDDSAKRAAFEQMASDADALRTSGASKNATDTANQIDAYALDTLGHASPDAISAELRSYGSAKVDGSGNYTPGSIDASGNIAPGSKLGNFLNNAIAGQASLNSGLAPSGAFPNGISSTLESLSRGSDPSLTQGVLSNVLQNFQNNPDQAKALQQQDNELQGGLQKSLGDALNASFDQYVGRNGTGTIDPQQRAELGTLGRIENTSTYDKNAASNFETTLQNHAQQLEDFAQGGNDQTLGTLYGTSPQGRQSAAAAAGDIAKAYFQGATDSVPAPPSDSLKYAKSYEQNGAQNPNGNIDATNLAQYVADGSNDDDRANRLQRVRQELGNDAAGKRAFFDVLNNAQGVPLSGANDAGNVKDAFQTLVNRGEFTPSDVNELVKTQTQAIARDTNQFGAIGETKSLSDYFKGLSSSDPMANGAKQAFVDASLRQGNSSPANGDPNLRGILYGQGAEVLGSMNASDIENEIGSLGQNGLPPVDAFVSGALDGEAARYRIDDANGLKAPSENGIASILNTLANTATPSQDGQPLDATAQKSITQIFNASMQYFHDNAFGDNEQALLKHDGNDGLRGAFNNALAIDFNGILQSNVDGDGATLSGTAKDTSGVVPGDGGFGTFETYSRLEFGNNANDDNAKAAQNILGGNFSQLYGSVLDYQNGNPNTLATRYPGTFGGQNPGLNATNVLGQLLGSTLNGMSLDYAQRQDEAQKQHDSAVQTYTNFGNIINALGAGVAAVNPAAGAAVGAVGAGFLEAANLQGTASEKPDAAYNDIRNQLAGAFIGNRNDPPGTYLTDGYIQQLEDGAASAIVLNQ